jgi:hypothetical protein
LETVAIPGKCFLEKVAQEYLPILQERKKWFRPKRNVQVGDLVLIVQENVSHGQWPKGLIEEVFPGKRGHVRQVVVTTATARM